VLIIVTRLDTSSSDEVIEKNLVYTFISDELHEQNLVIEGFVWPRWKFVGLCLCQEPKDATHGVENRKCTCRMKV
jgi:hypothetical protein